ncbi:hypothetical protein [Galbibacter sp.]|uniref:hypothetical protein n=1 Tax=Galbibacter sp. TaxID=2918471 RepID=UPI003A9040C8
MEYVKMIWDFMGEAGQNTAKHFEIHLKEFLSRDQVPYKKIGMETPIEQQHNLIYLIVEMSYVDQLRAALKPHRGQKVTLED